MDLLENINEWSEQEVNSTLQTTGEKLEGAKVCSEHQKKEYEMLQAYAEDTVDDYRTSPLIPAHHFDNFSHHENHSICSRSSNADHHIPPTISLFKSLSRLGHWDFDIFQLDAESHVTHSHVFLKILLLRCIIP